MPNPLTSAQVVVVEDWSLVLIAPWATPTTLLIVLLLASIVLFVSVCESLVPTIVPLGAVTVDTTPEESETIPVALDGLMLLPVVKRSLPAFRRPREKLAPLFS